MIVSDATRISWITRASATKHSYLLKSAQGTFNKCFIKETLQKKATNCNRFRLEIKGISTIIFYLYLFLALFASSHVFIVDNGFKQDGFITGIPSSARSNSWRYRISTNHKFRTEQGRTRYSDKCFRSDSVIYFDTFFYK